MHVYAGQYRGTRKDANTRMIELMRSNDLVMLSWISAHLDGANIGFVILDTHTSILEGSIGAIPRRVMVLDEDIDEAREILDSAPGNNGEI